MMRYKYWNWTLGGTALAISIGGTAQATTFTGYDNNTGAAPLTAATSPNSQAAFNSFLTNVNGANVTTESFETTPVGTAIDGLTKTISGTTATFAYTKKSDGTSATAGTTTQVQSKDTNGFTNAGTYPTDGNRGISINSANNFSISFNNLQAAFSFFGTDLGDNNNTLTVNLFNGITLVNSYIYPSNTGAANSSLFFYGFIADNSSQYFDKVALVSSIDTTGDAIGLDQITIGTPAQVSTKLPEPATIFGTMLLGGSIAAFKRKQQKIIRSVKK